MPSSVFCYLLDKGLYFGLEFCMQLYALTFFNIIIKIKPSLVTFTRMRETVTEMATGCLRMVKMNIFALNKKILSFS